MPGASETKFFEQLKDVFIGAEVEGVSGYINLMKIKSKYFDKVFKELQKEINEKTVEFPEFREELFDKLYSFFRRYFSESGSIYYRYTPFNERIYEKVYTDNKDVVMFWKTHMLYYVKTDMLLKSLEIRIDGKNFFFDASEVEHRKASEKRDLIYELKDIDENGRIVFRVLYSEKREKTDTKGILMELRKRGIDLDEETLERVFRIFEKQSEVDYFINKNAAQFLKEQFDLWLYQYILSDESWFTEKRIKQLKVLKEIAYKIIDFIAQFENELVKIWQKPKFVLKSNYVITLDRIATKPGGIELIGKIIERLKEQEKEFQSEIERLKKIKEGYKTYRERIEEAGEIRDQIAEWFLLDLIDEEFSPEKILIPTITGRGLNTKYQFLPIDTKYFKDIETEILGLFDNLDRELDGWFIKSDNWQALNTILPKFREKVQTIYIDPPFNTGSNEFTMYVNKFLDSAWITMMENRLTLAKKFLKETGSIFVRIDYHGNHYVRFLMDEIFGKENFRNEIMVSRTIKAFEGANRFIVANDSIFYYSKSDKSQLKPLKKQRGEQKWIPMHSPGIRWSKVPKQYLKYYSPEQLIEKNSEFYSQGRVFNNKVYMPPPGRHWTFTQERLDEYAKQGRIRVNPKTGILEYLTSEEQTVDSNWLDIPGYVVPSRWSFSTENSEQLLKRVIQASSNSGDIVMDFFLGSGTTTAVAHKLGRKWIGVEMGGHFYTVVLPRMKRVLAYDPSGISKDEDVKEIYNERKAGGFFKYYELEQYENTLRRVHYIEAEPFFDPTKDPYNQYIFMRDPKLLDALELDYKSNKVKVNLERLYENIDVAETISNLTGKMIKKISSDSVEFEDSEKVDLKDLDYKLIKPLIWWE